MSDSTSRRSHHRDVWLFLQIHLMRTKGTSYAQEGVLILLTSYLNIQMVDVGSQQYQAAHDAENSMSCFCHVLAQVSHKAKRISGSTSHGETLAANCGQQLAQLVALRITEVFDKGIQLPLRSQSPLQDLIAIQEAGAWVIPIDHFTDCHDLFQLVVGERGTPQDRFQRLYILSLREDRIKGAVRHFGWIPTAAMISDALTKIMISPILYDLLTHGYWRVHIVDKQKPPLIAPALELTEYTENDLINISKQPCKNFTTMTHFAVFHSRSCSRLKLDNMSDEPPLPRRPAPRPPWDGIPLRGVLPNAVVPVPGDTSSWKVIITAIYQEYDPDKLSRVDTLLQKYHMYEKDLYEVLIYKYVHTENQTSVSKAFQRRDWRNEPGSSSSTTPAPHKATAPASTHASSSPPLPPPAPSSPTEMPRVTPPSPTSSPPTTEPASPATTVVVSPTTTVQETTPPHVPAVPQSSSLPASSEPSPTTSMGTYASQAMGPPLTSTSSQPILMKITSKAHSSAPPPYAVSKSSSSSRPAASRMGPNQSLATNQCRVCGRMGHWGNECPEIFYDDYQKKKKRQRSPSPPTPPWRKSTKP